MDYQPSPQQSYDLLPFSQAFLFHPIAFCISMQDKMSAKNTLRITLLTDTCKNKTLERHEEKKQHVLNAV